MRARTLLIVVVLLAGIFVIGMALFGIQSPPPGPDNAPQQRQPMVVAAAAPIATGGLIKPQDLQFIPKANIAPGDETFDRVWAPRPDDQVATDQRTMTEVIGAVARRRIEVGEPIIRGSVVKPGDSGFLAAVLRPGMRAITVGVTAVSGTGGLIYPGDRVDMILTQTFPVADATLERRSVSETVAQDLRVLAIDQQLQVTAPPGSEGKLARTVTVEVDPRQAEGIQVATKLGDLSLTIRSLESVESQANSAAVGPVWAEDVSPALKATAQRNERPKEQANSDGGRPVVTVIRGDRIEGVH